MATEKTTPDVMEQLAEITGKPITQLLAEVQRLQEKADRADALEDALATATEKITHLAEQNGDLEDREKCRVLDEACRLGRIAPTDREHYWQTLQTVGEDVAHRWFAEGTIPVGSVAAPPAVEPEPTTPEVAFEKILDQLLSEGKNPAEAWDIARSSHGSTLYGTAEN